MNGPLIPPEVVPIIVIFVLIAVVSLIVRMSMASRLARRAGLDPNDAAMTTALSQDGLAATYVASSLANKQPTAGPARTTEQRLRELDQLHAHGLVNDAEYAEQRTRILHAL